VLSLSYPNAMKGEPCSQIPFASSESIRRLDSLIERPGGYHYAFAFTSNQDLKMAQPLPE